MSFRILLVLSILLSCSCGDKSAKIASNKNETLPVNWQPPVAGTIVDEYEKKVDEDKLNNKTFKVSILSTENSGAGIFLMKFKHGFNAHEKELTFPKWPGNVVLRPILKPGIDKYHCLVGFDANDNQFHEFYEVKVINGDLSIKQTTGYYPQK